MPSRWAALAMAWTGKPTMPNIKSTPCVLSERARRGAPSISGMCLSPSVADVAQHDAQVSGADHACALNVGVRADAKRGATDHTGGAGGADGTQHEDDRAEAWTDDGDEADDQDQRGKRDPDVDETL